MSVLGAQEWRDRQDEVGQLFMVRRRRFRTLTRFVRKARRGRGDAGVVVSG